MDSVLTPAHSAGGTQILDISAPLAGLLSTRRAGIVTPVRGLGIEYVAPVFAENRWKEPMTPCRSTSH